MKLGLDNIRRLLATLGSPETEYIKVQVAGTNGKGSVCAFLDSICNTAGIKTGLFTSPHLISITERIKINGVEISDYDFARHSTLVRKTAENLLEIGDINYRPTFFEQVTAIALVAFAEAQVEVAILETGLGGRLDATTAANAEIAAITRIDLDHQEYLGETIEEIAAEKAAIVGPNSEVIIAEQSAGVSDFLAKRMKEIGVSAIFADFVSVHKGEAGLVFQTDLTDYEVGSLGLEGAHQIENAKVAILVAERLAHRCSMIKADTILGLRSARHPGRLEFEDRYLFDGAHNVSGAKALRSYLDESVTKPITLIFGVMKGKQVAEIAKILLPAADKLILTKPSNSRSLKAEEILLFIPTDIERSNIVLTDSVEPAIEKALEITPENGLIVVTGSLYLVGEAKKILNN